MTVTQYIGARYVPLFDGEWDSSKQYEPLTIVLYQGNSYTSIQAVPSNIAITNTEYWAQTGNYNAQVEAYRNEVLAFGGRIDDLEAELPTADFDNVNTVKAAIDAEATARIAADNALKQNLENYISDMENLEGYAKAKYEVFTDYTSYASGSNDNVWDYFKSVFNETTLDMNINIAPNDTGWVNTNSAGENAALYLKNIAENQTSEYRNLVQFVILNFGFYDIVNNTSGDYEAEGRRVVNYASDYYPNAVIIVNPCSNNYCYGYGRSYQLRMYQLNYGMARSQVPVKIVPWHVAFNVNQLSPNHYYDSSAPNPTLLNSGGTNSIAAMIKCTLFGCESAYQRVTRSNLNNFLDSDYFTSAYAEFFFDVETMHVSLSAGKITAQQAITQETVIGFMTYANFAAQDDIILALCIQNTLTDPIKGYLVLGANGNIYFRRNGETTVNSGAILRLLPCASYEPSFIVPSA